MALELQNSRGFPSSGRDMRHQLSPRKIYIAALLASVLFVAPLASVATPVSYQIEFAIDTIDGATDPGQCPPGDPNGPGGFNCSVAVGDSWFGEFTIDDALLADDGENLGAIVYDFVIEIAGILWDFLAPDPDSAFYGFRGPDGLGSASPGFDVVDGEIVNLRGGVYGLADVPYVDFSPLGPYGGLNRFGTGDGRTFAYGDMFVTRVTEPATWALVVAGLGALIAARRRPARARTRTMSS
jgi:hypothetical protein